MKLSSAGLVFKYFGREIVDNICLKWKTEITDAEWEDLEQDIYSKLILEVDAIDNGVS